MTKYRQSAGWDMSGGEPRLGRTIEAVSLTAALPGQTGLIVAGTEVLYDDFEQAAGLDLGLWNKTSFFANNGAYGSPPATYSIGGSLRARSGTTGGADSGGQTYADRHIPARTGQIAEGFNFIDDNQAGINYPIAREDTALGAAGTWKFTAYTGSSAIDVVHVAFAFLYGDTGGYIFEVFGSNMTRARLIKNSAAFTSAMKFTASDVVVKTLDGTGGTTAPVGGSASAREYKITRDNLGNFEFFEQGVSLGTATDTTYSSPKFIGFATQYKADAAGVFPAVPATCTYVDDIYLPSTGSADLGTSTSFINYNSALYCAWYTAGAAFLQTTVKNASLASNQPLIVHVNARSLAVWSRDQEPTANKNVFLAMARGQVFRVYNGATQVYTGATACYGGCVIPINSTTIVVAGTTAENSGVPVFEVIAFTAGAWTVASQKVVTLDGNYEGQIVTTAALDSSGALYLAISDLALTDGTVPSRLFIIGSADLLATRPTVTSSTTFSDFVIRGILSMAGTVYLTGARVRGTTSYASVLKYPSTVVWESTLGKALYPATAAIKYNHGVSCFWKNVDNFIFLGMNDLALWDPVLRVDLSANVIEVSSFVSKQFTPASATLQCVAEWAGSFYFLDSISGTIKRVGTARGGLGADHATAVLEMSAMGANTDLITKTLYSVTVELSAVVPTGETLSVLVNDTVIGTMVLADGVKKEMVLSSELTASAFTCKLRWPQASTWTGYVKNGPLLKYVPTQFKMRAWGFGIRATKRLKLGDGTHESRTPATMFADIEAAWASNTPVTFIDVDGVSYSVLVTDFKQKRPLLSIGRQTDAEAFFFLELLQAAPL